jgi:peptidoglycan/LPS O-acetylase OafA/YrhL
MTQLLTSGRHGINTSSARPTQPGLRRFDELESYRGIAAVLIVVFHVYQYARIGPGSRFAYQGTAAYTVLHQLDGLVDMFFVLSAFLLTRPIVTALLDEAPRVQGRGFLVRRALRIVPLYYVTVLIVWSARNSGFPGDWRDLLEHLTFTQVFDSKRIFYTIGPAWALSVEALFYLFLAVAAVTASHLLTRLATRRTKVVALIVSLLGLIAASMAYKWWALDVAHVAPDRWAYWYNPLAKLDVFGFGMLLAVIAAAGRVELRTAARAGLRISCLGLLAVAFVIRRPGTSAGLYFDTLSGLAFALLLAASVLGPPGSRWQRALARRPLLLLGLFSYSIYLWHEPIMLFFGSHHLLISQQQALFPASAAALVVLAVLAGWLSYWAIEYPAMQLRATFDSAGRFIDYYADNPSRRRRHNRTAEEDAKLLL